MKSKKEMKSVQKNNKIDKIEPPSPPRVFRFYPLILIVLIGTLSYSNIFSNPFVFDDLQITQFEGIHLDSFSASKLGRLRQTLAEQSRPVVMISFAANYYFGGLNTFGYHLVNLFIHLLTAILLYFFLRLTLNLPVLEGRYGKEAQEIALLCSLLFVSHPVQTQAVTYIIQRMASMAAMFYLLSLLAYVKGRIAGGRKGTMLYIISALSALLAFGSKQHTVTLPVIILLYEFFFFLGLDFKRHKKKLNLLFIPLVVGIFYLWNTDWVLTSYSQLNFSMGERVLTELRVIIYYTSLLLLPLPSRLNVDYEYSISTSLLVPPTTIVSLMALIGLIIIAVRIAKKKPLFSYSIFWFLGTLAPESTILPLDIIFEHRLYLPSVGFFIIVSLVLVKLFDNIPQKYKLKTQWATVSLLVLLLGWGTYQRNKVWASSISLWEDVVQKTPQNARALNSLGAAYSKAGLIEKALEACNRAVLINPYEYLAFDNIGRLYLKIKKPDQAIEASNKSIKLNPDFMPAYNTLGMAYNRKKMYDRAIKSFLETLRSRPNYPPSYIKPNYVESYLNLAQAYEGKGKYNKSLEFLQKAEKLIPGDPTISYKRGRIYYQKEMYETAISEYKKVVALSPKNPQIYNDLGLAYAKNNMYQEAKEALLKAVAIDTNFYPAHKNLGNIYYLLKMNDKAIEEWKRALTLNPHDKALANKLRTI